MKTMSFLFLFRRFYLEYMRTMSLTDDFWHHQLAPFVGKKTVTIILPLPRQRLVRYSPARWQPITIPQKNHALLPLKDRYKPQLWLWNALLSKTTTWRNSCAKGMLGLIVTEKSKRALALKGRTEKDQKTAMLRADKSDKILSVHLSQKQNHYTQSQRYR